MKKAAALIFALFIAINSASAASRPMPEFKPICDSIVSYFADRATLDRTLYVSGASVANHQLNIIFSSALSEFPLRESDISEIYAIVDDLMPERFSKYIGNATIRTDGRELADIVSKYYALERYNDNVKEHIRLTKHHRDKMEAPLVSNASSPCTPAQGLQGRHIALWQSHGYYYEPSLMRWEWQRGRIFGTVEDLYTQSYVIPFLLPMLENAGAVVLLPRERDWGTTELIVDNDDADTGYGETGEWRQAPEAGFRNACTYYINGQNPFGMGTARVAKKGGATAHWTPTFPHSGNYTVYVSYQTVAQSSAKAQYEVRHSGGSTLFRVNQKMGGGTWICLGSFHFDSGSENGQGVYLTNASETTGSIISADAVKFGGGLGNIARAPLEGTDQMEPETSRYPRAAEGARYWLQWAGFCDTIYSPTGFAKDYTDDFQCRAKWVNALAGGSYVCHDQKGYNIPLDLSFAFHTDAGLRQKDTTVGTLAIYTSVVDKKDIYPNGEKRETARDYADVIQSQIVSDIRATFNEDWTRRGLRDKTYAECSRPAVPSMILELLSHQNFNDMKYGLDPRFRFVVSRAIYKGMLKYLAYINHTDFTVQPLPVQSFSAVLQRDEEESTCHAELSWQSQNDPLERTADPEAYIVYTRKGTEGGFDNGTLVEGCRYRAAIEPGCVYSFKVCAVNKGGKSFDSEVLAVGATSAPTPRKALIVNNFNRISAPMAFAMPDSSYAGFLYERDFGVPYKSDIAFCGNQYDFTLDQKWKDDDNPGFGASLSDYETMEIAGNTFDYPALHGHALLAAGWDFSSCSVASYRDSAICTAGYAALDLICGKQDTVFTKDLVERLSAFSAAGGNILVSGSNIASYLRTDTLAMRFASEVLKYKYMTSHAAVLGKFHSLKTKCEYAFATKPNPDRYHVESADGIVPVKDSLAKTVFRYDGNNISAGVAYLGPQYHAKGE